MPWVPAALTGTLSGCQGPDAQPGQQEPLDPRRKRSTHRWAGPATDTQGMTAPLLTPEEGAARPTLTCPPSSNGPTWENQAREQNQVGMITVGPLEVKT